MLFLSITGSITLCATQAELHAWMLQSRRSFAPLSIPRICDKSPQSLPTLLPTTVCRLPRESGFASLEEPTSLWSHVLHSCPCPKMSLLWAPAERGRVGHKYDVEAHRRATSHGTRMESNNPDLDRSGKWDPVMLTAFLFTLLWLRVARGSPAGLLFCEPRGWRAAIDQSAYTLLCCDDPGLHPVLRVPLGLWRWISSRDMSRVILDELVGTEAMHARFYCEKRVEMANCRRRLGFIQTGWLHLRMQSLFVVSHEARIEAFCLFSSRC